MSFSGADRTGSPRQGWLFAGLFCTTFATLLLETLDARLLSVLAWYHLSFLAVSVAMLGMAAGAVRVFLAGAALDGADALRRLPCFAGAFAATMALSHVVVLSIPLSGRPLTSPMGFAAFATAIGALTVPFYFSGVTVTLALTRTAAPIGRLYAWDLAGAAFGCLAVVPILDSGRFNLSSLVLLGAAVAAAGAWCFSHAFARRYGATASLSAIALAALAIVNGAGASGIEVTYPKNRLVWTSELIDRTYWNSHSYVIIEKARLQEPFMWGAGAARERTPIPTAWMTIDGEAGTPISGWNGDSATLDWVRHDVTALPYHLRRGSAAVIGVGGGRDILAAIWGGNAPITGIDVNATMLRLLTVTHRRFAGIADRPEVRLVHDDARTHLTRSTEQYHVIQMSLIDTWAATGAGAFSLSENGLYTTDAWKVVLARLKPRGVFSVSRWFSPDRVSETSRLLALATAALVERGVSDPLTHTLLVSRGSVATLVISPAPFDAADRAAAVRVAEEEGFTIQVAPWHGSANARLDAIVRSRTVGELAQATFDPNLDFRPPSDNRPFFFNMLKPASFFRTDLVTSGGVIGGNIRATTTLVMLFLIAAGMVGAIIVWPLVTSGHPPVPPRTFAAALAYFAAIGFGFMLAQIALLQRFSVYLGHPTHTLAITLFSMILFAGIGSFLSDHFSPTSARRLQRTLPLAAAACLLLLVFGAPVVTDATIGFGMAIRSFVVVALLGPLSILLGFFFPMGLRLIAQTSPAMAAWMWGVNGACGVLGSIVAVAVSMWIGIHANLIGAAALYALLLIPLAVLQRVPLLQRTSWDAPRAGEEVR